MYVADVCIFSDLKCLNMRMYVLRNKCYAEQISLWCSGLADLGLVMKFPSVFTES